MGKQVSIKGHYHISLRVDAGSKPYVGRPIARLGDVCEYDGKIVEGLAWLTCE